MGHALLIIGHQELEPYSLSDSAVSKKGIFDTADLEKKFVIIDDNHTPYKMVNLNNPTEHYGEDPIFKGGKISTFIAPLYSKIYKEAEHTRDLSLSIIRDKNKAFGFYNQISTDKKVFRFLLTSSRSFKEFVLENENLKNTEAKRILLERPMPKFIFLSEITNNTFYREKKAVSIIIIDATEPNDAPEKSLLLILTPKLIIVNINGKLKEITHEKDYFDMYVHNLILIKSKSHGTNKQ